MTDFNRSVIDFIGEMLYNYFIDNFEMILCIYIARKICAELPMRCIFTLL